MKIRKVHINRKKKTVEIETKKGWYILPFRFLMTQPTKDNPIERAYVDRELGNEAVTYELNSGDVDSVHLEAFLEYAEEPEYLAKLKLHEQTVRANELLEKSGISKRELCRRLGTSPSQLSRLLDPTYYGKSAKDIFQLIIAMGYDIEIEVHKKEAS